MGQATAGGLAVAFERCLTLAAGNPRHHAPNTVGLGRPLRSACCRHLGSTRSQVQEQVDVARDSAEIRQGLAPGHLRRPGAPTCAPQLLPRAVHKLHGAHRARLQKAVPRAQVRVWIHPGLQPGVLLRACLRGLLPHGPRAPPGPPDPSVGPLFRPPGPHLGLQRRPRFEASAEEGEAVHHDRGQGLRRRAARLRPHARRGLALSWMPLGLADPVP
mmetsp:Transcript_13215/g.29992  ORF Transcript_13215/g.29992 Transcript_13215/m.29992 type:complete len:216 (-) Transcript_13215:629-1276(-)